MTDNVSTWPAFGPYSTYEWRCVLQQRPAPPPCAPCDVRGAAGLGQVETTGGWRSFVQRNQNLLWVGAVAALALYLVRQQRRTTFFNRNRNRRRNAGHYTVVRRSTGEQVAGPTNATNAHLTATMLSRAERGQSFQVLRGGQLIDELRVAPGQALFDPRSIARNPCSDADVPVVRAARRWYAGRVAGAPRVVEHDLERELADAVRRRTNRKRNAKRRTVRLEGRLSAWGPQAQRKLIALLAQLDAVLAPYLASGTIRAEGRQYVGQAADGTWITVGNVPDSYSTIEAGEDAEFLLRYLATNPDPKDW